MNWLACPKSPLRTSVTRICACVCISQNSFHQAGPSLSKHQAVTYQRNTLHLGQLFCLPRVRIRAVPSRHCCSHCLWALRSTICAHSLLSFYFTTFAAPWLFSLSPVPAFVKPFLLLIFLPQDSLITNLFPHLFWSFPHAYLQPRTSFLESRCLELLPMGRLLLSVWKAL